MSATLSWNVAGVGTKTGTTVGAMFDDMLALFASKASDADFLWEVKGSNAGSTPYYISLGRKDGTPGRIALILWSTAPAANHTALLEQAPTNNLFVAWFPNGTGTTLANLTAASGAITGDDTDCVKVSPGNTVASMYSSQYCFTYAECQEGMIFGFGYTIASTLYLCGAGNLIVDAADVAYGCTFGFGITSASAFGQSSSAPLPWASSVPGAGNASAALRTNYGSSGRAYFHAYQPSGSWASSSPSSTDILTNAVTQTFYFAPVPLLGHTKGEGIVLKWRQIVWGPGTISAFQPFYENDAAGPVLIARQLCMTTSGSSGNPWLYNRKI